MSDNSYSKSIANIIVEHFKELDEVVKECDELNKLKNEYYQVLNESYSKADFVSRLKERFTKKRDETEEKYKKAKNDLGLHCDGIRTLEPLTVGIFGEWGSGKTFILKGIKEEINKKQEQNIELWETTKKEIDIKDNFEPIIIPIFFNAWRFEKEEHIIIPLFKTLVATLSEYEHITLLQKVYSKAKLLSSALVKGLQFPKELPDISKLFAGDISELKKLSLFFNWNKVKENSSYEKMLKATITNDRIESIYLNIPQWIEKMILLDDVRFLFLIDDLDRCLPENALKMLESIKLFLDVAGCSFVLAVDDDVIERGVEHHYKEYILNGSNKNIIPITGNEYLEKIVQLPFRIPPKDDNDIEKILEKYNNIFKEKSKDRHKNKEEIRENRGLKEFFIKTIPPLPRKVIRVVNLYKSKLDIIEKFDNSIDKILITKIVLLELFAPKLFRFIKNSGHKYQFERLVLWKADESIKYLTETKKIEEWIENKKLPQKEEEIAKNLIAIVEKIYTLRVNLELDYIFEDIDYDKLDSYIKLKKLKKEQIVEENIQKLKPVNQDIFEEYIFSNDPISWQKAFEEDINLKNNYLYIDDKFIKKAKEFASNPKWLEIVSKHLSKKDFKKLIQETKPLERLLNGK